jgi:hypothetical protein
MRLLLFRQHKDGAPVSRSDCMQLVNKVYKDKRQLGPAVLASAQARFLSLLGMEMLEVDKAKPGGLAAAGDAKALLKAAAAEAKSGAGGRLFLLRSALPLRLRSRVVELPEAAAADGFAVAVLSLVSLAGEVGLAESTLWTQLASLGAGRGAAAAHPALGEPEALLNALLKQRYLQRSKAPDGGSYLHLAEAALEASCAAGVAGFVKNLVHGGGGGGGGGAGAAAGGGSRADAGPSR